MSETTPDPVETPVETPADPAPEPQVYVATETGFMSDGRQLVRVEKDKTRVVAGHALLRKNPQFFKPSTAHFGVEVARVEPVPEPRVAPEATATVRRGRARKSAD